MHKCLFTTYLLLIASFLAIVAASAWAVTTYQEVTVTVSNTTSSCGTPAGAAAADVAAANFTTCARYSDWTTTIPNSVGTGLPSNWLDCSGSSTTTPLAQWTWFTNLGPCSMVVQQTDPTTGGLALHITEGPSTSWFYELGTGPQAGDFNPATYANKNWTYPMGVYIEYVLRDDSQYINGYNDEVNFWTFNLSVYGTGNTGLGTCAGTGWQYGTYIELDFNETTSLPGGAGYTTHDWLCNGTADQNGPYNYSLTLSNYTTYGYLITNDGNNNLATCVYINGTRQFCQTSATTDSQGTIYGRNTLQFTESYNDCNSSVCPNPINTYIKYFKVFTCGQWLNNSTPTNQACSGSASNGSFYTGAPS